MTATINGSMTARNTTNPIQRKIASSDGVFGGGGSSFLEGFCFEVNSTSYVFPRGDETNSFTKEGAPFADPVCIGGGANFKSSLIHA